MRCVAPNLSARTLSLSLSLSREPLTLCAVPGHGYLQIAPSAFVAQVNLSPTPAHYSVLHNLHTLNIRVGQT